MQSIKSRPKREHQGLRLHTILEAAELLGDASESHVYRLIEKGALRAVDIAPPGSARSKTRIRSDDLAAYIERQTRDAR